MWIRALAGLLACVFALPACMTMMLWDPDHGVEDQWSASLTDAAQFVRPDDGGPLLVVDCKLDPGDRLRASTEPARRWLVIEPTEYPETLTRIEAMFAGNRPPFRTWLQRSLATPDAPQHDDLVFWLGQTNAEAVPEGVWQLEGRHRRRLFYGNSYEIRVPCRLRWSDAPPKRSVAWPGGAVWCTVGPPLQTPNSGRILLTPLAVLGDVVLLPFELLTIWAWW